MSGTCKAYKCVFRDVFEKRVCIRQRRQAWQKSRLRWWQWGSMSLMFSGISQRICLLFAKLFWIFEREDTHRTFARDKWQALIHVRKSVELDFKPDYPCGVRQTSCRMNMRGSQIDHREDEMNRWPVYSSVFIKKFLYILKNKI